MWGTYVPGFGPGLSSSPELVAPMHCGQPAYHWVTPTVDAMQRVLAGEVMPVLDITRDRAGFGTWVSADPTRVPIPLHRPTYALLLARWGLIDQAARVVEHLDRHWPSLRVTAMRLQPANSSAQRAEGSRPPCAPASLVPPASR